MDFYILKPEITGQQSKKLSKNAKNHNLLKTKNKLTGSLVYTFSLPGERFATDADLCCILSLYNNIE